MIRCVKIRRFRDQREGVPYTRESLCGYGQAVSVLEELTLIPNVDEDGSNNDCPPPPRTFETVIGAIACIDLRGIMQRFKRKYELNSNSPRIMT